MRFHERSSFDKLRDRCDETLLLDDAAATGILLLADAAATGVHLLADAAATCIIDETDDSCDDSAGLMQCTMLCSPAAPIAFRARTSTW